MIADISLVSEPGNKAKTISAVVYSGPALSALLQHKQAMNNCTTCMQ